MTTGRWPRLGALDLLRGASVAAMIVVNNPGNWNNVFPQLTHAAWNGVTVADLIFPAFIFIMGVAMALAGSPGRRGTSGRARYGPIVARGLLLIALGLVLNLANAWPDAWSMRVPGVLQRIGATYIVAGVVMATATELQEWLFILGALGLHSGLLAIGPSLEPGVNVGAVIDRIVFGAHTLTAAGDPEGLLGLLTCSATALLGAATGRAIRRDAQRQTDGGWRGTAARLALAGALAVAIGYAWSFVLPLNKALWTASFTLVSAGMTALCLAACLFVVPAEGPRITAPLFWLGTNPLAVYFLSEFTTTLAQRAWLPWGAAYAAPKDLVYWVLIVPLAGDNGGRWSSLAYGVFYAWLWIAVAGVMRWKGVRVRV